MTEVKKYKNKYDHLVVDCPFCSHFCYVRKVSPDPLRDLKRHITNQAKNEAIIFCTTEGGGNILAPHLLYYKQHTSEKRVITTDKRNFDDDLTIMQ